MISKVFRWRRHLDSIVAWWKRRWKKGLSSRLSHFGRSGQNPYGFFSHTQLATNKRSYLNLSDTENTNKKPSPERIYCSLMALNSSWPAVSKTVKRREMIDQLSSFSLLLDKHFSFTYGRHRAWTKNSNSKWLKTHSL